MRSRKRTVLLNLYDEPSMSPESFFVETELSDKELRERIWETAQKLQEEDFAWTCEELIEKLEQDGVLKISPLDDEVSILNVRV